MMTVPAELSRTAILELRYDNSARLATTTPLQVPVLDVPQLAVLLLAAAAAVRVAVGVTRRAPRGTAAQRAAQRGGSRTAEMRAAAAAAAAAAVAARALCSRREVRFCAATPVSPAGFTSKGNLVWDLTKPGSTFGLNVTNASN
jgi:hypothetical protein